MRFDSVKSFQWSLEFAAGLLRRRPPLLLIGIRRETETLFGGVVPNLAKREHIKNLPLLLQQLFGKKPLENNLLKNIDLIAVTSGPGLEPALWAGINFAEELTKELKKPLVGANHLDVRCRWTRNPS